jgi:hypothetical protein
LGGLKKHQAQKKKFLIIMRLPELNGAARED